MMCDSMLVAAKSQAKEWQGATSAKFTTAKRHLAPPQPDNNAPHPLFNMGSRKHFSATYGDEFVFKPHRQQTKAVSHADEK